MANTLVASTIVLTCACGPGGSTRASSPSNTTASEVGSAIPRERFERDCFSRETFCNIEIDFDGDGQKDRVESVRLAPCDEPPLAPEDEESGDIVDPPCRQGFQISLATGKTLHVGAGRALPAVTTSDPDLEPLAIDADLGGLRVIDLAHPDAHGGMIWSGMFSSAIPCDGEGIVITGGDAAALLCWYRDAPALFHLGF